MVSDGEDMTHDEIVAWLSFLAYEGDTLGEGELAAAGRLHVWTQNALVASRLDAAHLARKPVAPSTP